MAGWNEWIPGRNMTLTEVLDALESARVGLDVKDKLYWSFYKMMELAIKEGNANFEVAKAAGAFKDLASRLDASDADMRNISVNWINKNLGKLDQTFMTDEFLQQMAGNTPINAVPADGSVTLTKTAFSKVVSKNKFDKANAHLNKSLGGDGNLYDSASFHTSDYIPTKAGDIWLATNSLQSYAVYDTDKTLKKGVNPHTSTKFTSEFDGYIRVCFYHTALENFMISNSGLPVQYEPFKRAILRDYVEDIGDGTIDMDKLKFSRVLSRNLFDKSKAVIGALDSSGTLQKHSENYRTTDYIPVSPNDKITFGGRSIEGYAFKDSGGNVVDAGSGESLSTLNAPENASYVSVSFWYERINEFMVVVGEPLTEYEPFKMGIPNEYLEAPDFTAIKGKYEIEENIGGIYERTDTEYLNSWTMTSVEVYQVFDGIVNDFPNWASRVQYGTSADGKPIYKYTFKPEMTQKERVEQPLPLFVVTNTHSFEKPALAGTTQFFKDLAYNWKSNNELRVIRWNIHFEVIPVVSPYGVDNRSRPNSNGVDINRNFTAGWNTEGENGNFGSDYYAGTEPMSEPETKTLDKLMNEYKHADYAIDVHNYTTLAVSAPSSVLWVGSNESETRSKLTGYVHQTASIAQAKYIDGNVIGYENKALGLVENNMPYGGATVWQWESYGVPTTLLELVSDFGTTPQEVQQFSVEALGNLILNGLRKFVLGS